MEKISLKLKLIEAVCNVVATEGLENATTKKICKEIKTPETTIYYYYKSKKGLLEAAFAEINRQIDNALGATYDSLSNNRNNIEEVALSIWNSYLDFWINHRDYTMFYDIYIHSHYISPDVWLRQIPIFVRFESVFRPVMHHVHQSTDANSYYFVWSVIINSAITLAKQSILTGKPVTEATLNIAGEMIKRFLNIGKDTAQQPEMHTRLR